MKILLVNSIVMFDRYEIHNGTLLLGTILKQAGFDVEIIDFNYLCLTGQMNYRENMESNFSQFSDYIVGKNPDVVGFSTIANFYVESVLVAQQIKASMPSTTILFGGPHATVTAADTLRAFPWVDIICLGEGEHVVTELVTCLQRHEPIDTVPGIAYRAGGDIVMGRECSLSNLDELPFLDYSLIASHIPTMRFVNFEEGRGCPYNCTFCLTQEFWKRKFRMKSAARIVEEIKYIKVQMAQYADQPFVFNFCHDNFTASKALVFEICDSLIAEGIQLEFTVSSRLDTIDEETVVKLKQSGCKKIFFGIESGSDRIQKQIRKNLNLKNFDTVMSWIKKYDLVGSLSFIYGFEDETIEDMAASLELIARAIRLDIPVLYYNLSVFPGTELYNQVQDKLYLDPSVVVGCGFDTLIPKAENSRRMALIRDYKSIFSSFYSFPKKYLGQYSDMMFFIAYIIDEYKRLAQTSFKLMMNAYDDDLLAIYHDFKKCCPDLNARFGTYDNLVYEDGALMAEYEKKVWESLEIFVNNTTFAEYDCVIKQLFAFMRDLEAFKQTDGAVQVMDYSIDTLAIDMRNNNMEREVALDDSCYRQVRLEFSHDAGGGSAAADYDFKVLSIVNQYNGRKINIRRLGESAEAAPSGRES